MHSSLPCAVVVNKGPGHSLWKYDYKVARWTSMSSRLFVRQPALVDRTDESWFKSANAIQRITDGLFNCTYSFLTLSTGEQRNTLITQFLFPWEDTHTHTHTHTHTQPTSLCVKMFHLRDAKQNLPYQEIHPHFQSSLLWDHKGWDNNEVDFQLACSRLSVI